jgi:hypothetical protein
MHTPITTLKSAAHNPESTTVVDVVRKLFNLRVEPPIKPMPASATPPPEREQSAVSVAASSPPVKQKLG